MLSEQLKSLKKLHWRTTGKTENITWFLLIEHNKHFVISSYQFLYADCYLTKPEFLKMFDMRLYDQVRERYQCADAFPHVYDKIAFSARKWFQYFSVYY